MIETLLRSIIELLIITPLVVLSLDKAKPKKWRLLILFYSFFIYNGLLLSLPREIPFFKLIDGNWNWTGKIYAITGSILFYFAFRKQFAKNDFMVLKQKRSSIRPNLIALLIVIIVSVVLGSFMAGKGGLDLENLGFQLTMPGLDEEIAFRGIMIGVLSTILVDKFRIQNFNIINPAILITGLLFGLVHGLSFGETWSLQMNWFYFSYTFSIGLVLGWMTLKSRSILMPIISHNALNFFGNLIVMIK